MIELLRERVEAEAEAILAPYFEALARGEGVEQRMRAAERLLDRVFGRPKRSAELSGSLSIDERRLEAEVEEELAALVRVALAAEQNCGGSVSGSRAWSLGWGWDATWRR